MRNPLIYKDTGVPMVPKSLVSGWVYVLFPAERTSVISWRHSFFSYSGCAGFPGSQGVTPWFFFLLTLVLLVIKGLQLNG